MEVEVSLSTSVHHIELVSAGKTTIAKGPRMSSRIRCTLSSRSRPAATAARVAYIGNSTAALGELVRR